MRLYSFKKKIIREFLDILSWPIWKCLSSWGCTVESNLPQSYFWSSYFVLGLPYLPPEYSGIPLYFEKDFIYIKWINQTANIFAVTTLFVCNFFVHPAKETGAISVSCFLLCLAPLEYLACLPKIAFVYALWLQWLTFTYWVTFSVFVQKSPFCPQQHWKRQRNDLPCCIYQGCS